MCGLGVPVGCRMKHTKRMFKRCGLGAALLPARFGRSEKLLHSLHGFKDFKVFEGF